MRLNGSLAWIATLGILLFTGGLAESVPVLTFDDEGLGEGVISYAGGNTPAFTSTPITITRLSGSDTPFNDGDSFTCFGCVLEFTTGSAVSNPTGGIEYQFSGGGTFEITGTIIDLGIFGETLLIGTFTDAFYDRQGQQWFFTISGFDQKHDLIVQHYFGTTDLDFSFGNTEIVASPDAGGANNSLGAFDSDISQADVNNFVRVPEPGSAFLLLLGLGSLSLAAYRRRS